MNLSLESKIESYLFFKGEPVEVKELSKVFDVSAEDITSALAHLKESTTERGIVLLESAEGYELGTHPDMGAQLAELRKVELNRELSKASVETLSIILYTEGTTRAEIDYIRGVSSSFILRSLLVRGLIVKKEDPTDARRILYAPSSDVLLHLGVRDLSELPEYQKLKTELESARSGAEVVAENSAS